MGATHPVPLRAPSGRRTVWQHSVGPRDELSQDVSAERSEAVSIVAENRHDEKLVVLGNPLLPHTAIKKTTQGE